MTTYDRLCADLKGSRHRDARGRKIGNNTWLRYAGNGLQATKAGACDRDYGLPASTLVVQLHNTNIIYLLPDYTAVFNSGGWQTVTTKDRMNEYARGLRSIYSEKGQWFVGSEDQPFFDGILVSCGAGAEGVSEEHAQMALNAIKNQGDRLVYADWLDEHGQQEAAAAHRILWNEFCGQDWEPPSVDRQKSLRKKVDKYARDFVAALAAGDVERPGSGDCFICSMNPDDSDHILSHIEESYFVPRLLYNVLSGPGISAWARGYVQAIWNGEPPYDDRGNIAQDQIRKAIRKYCLKRLAMPV